MVTRRADDLFVLEGELDMASRPILERSIDAAAVNCETLVLDVLGLTFIDASGIHCLISILGSMGSGQLILRGAQRQIREVLKITGAADISNLRITS